MKETKFKQTEVGMIPSDWDVKRVDDCGVLKSGESPSNFTFSSSGIPYFKVDQMNNCNKYQVETPYYILEHVSIPKGSILFPKRGAAIETNKIRILEQDSFFDTNIMGLTLDSSVHNEYFFYWLVKKELWKIADTTSVPQINNKHIKPLLFPCPTIEEQQRIANALSDVDTLIANLEKLIAKKKNIKQGAMQQLLTGKKRLPGFGSDEPTYKQTELGKIPTDWEVKPLKKIGVFSKGAGISRDESNSGNIPAVRYGEIYTKHNDYIKKFYSHISQDVADKSVKMQKGDLLFSASGETKEDIGKTIAFVDDFDAYAGGDIIIFTPTETIDSIYMGYLLNFPSIAKQKAMKAQGDAVVHITTDSLKKLAVCLPSPQEQTAIANVLSDMDTEISALETKLAKYRTLKTGMMQQLLTGKIRLV